MKKEIREKILQEFRKKFCYKDDLIRLNQFGSVNIEQFWFSKLEQREKEILEEYRKVESKIDKPTFVFLYGMKVKENPSIPKGEIWIATDKQKVKIK